LTVGSCLTIGDASGIGSRHSIKLGSGLGPFLRCRIENRRLITRFLALLFGSGSGSHRFDLENILGSFGINFYRRVELLNRLLL
jgi:hypothetical protein